MAAPSPVLTPGRGPFRPLKKVTCPECGGDDLVKQDADNLRCASQMCSFIFKRPRLVISVEGEREKEVQKYAAWLMNRLRFGVWLVAGTAIGWLAHMYQGAEILWRSVGPFIGR
jgi:hypothetical protein